MDYIYVYVVDGDVVWEARSDDRTLTIGAGAHTQIDTGVTWPTTYNVTLNGTGVSHNLGSLNNIPENTQLTLTFTPQANKVLYLEIDSTWVEVTGTTYSLNVTGNHVIDVTWYDDIQAARGAALNDVVTVIGIVTEINGDNVSIQDSTAGINIYKGKPATLAVGDKVKVTGTRAAFNELVQIKDTTEYVILSTENELPAAVALANLENLSNYMSERISITPNLDFVSKSGQNFVFKYGDNQITLRAPDTTGDVYNALNAIDYRVKVNGTHILSWFNGAQLNISDVTQITAVAMTDAEKLAAIQTYLVDTYNNESYNSGTTVNLPSAHPTLGGHIEWSYEPSSAVSGGKWDVTETQDVTATASIVIGGASGNQAVTINVVYVDPSSEVEALLFSYNFLDGGDSSNSGYANTDLTTNVSYASDNPGGTAGTTSWNADYANLNMDTETRLGGKLASTETGSPSANVRTNFNYDKVITKVEILGAKKFGTQSRVGNVYLQSSSDDGVNWSTVGTFTGLTGTAQTITFDSLNIASNSRIKIVVEVTASTSDNSGLAFTGIKVYGLTVLTESDKAQADLNEISFASEYTAPTILTLDTVGSVHGSSIQWSSTDEAIINPTTGQLSLPENTTQVTLTANATNGATGTAQKQFVISVKGEGNIISEELANLGIPGSTIADSITLAPTTTSGYAVSWSSTETAINPDTGAVTRGADDVIVDLTATVNTPYLRTYTYNVTVVGLRTELQEQLGLINAPQTEVTENFSLDATTQSGLNITWTSYNSAITINGTTAEVEQPTDADAEGYLRASVTKNSVTEYEDFNVTVKKAGAAANETFTETFATSTAGSSYGDGSFTGVNGILWTFVHARNEDTFPIDGEGILLRHASAPSSLSATFTTGITSFSFKYRKAYTGTAKRTYAVDVTHNGITTTYQIPEFGAGVAGDPTIYNFTKELNLTGTVTIKIYAIGSTSNQQAVFDDFTWTTNPS